MSEEEKTGQGLGLGDTIFQAVQPSLLQNIKSFADNSASRGKSAARRVGGTGFLQKQEIILSAPQIRKLADADDGQNIHFVKNTTAGLKAWFIEKIFSTTAKFAFKRFLRLFKIKYDKYTK